MVADVPRTFEVVMMTMIGAVLTIKEVQRRGCERQLCLMITWATE
jgi:hypothetical protein